MRPVPGRRSPLALLAAVVALGCAGAAFPPRSGQALPDTHSRAAATSTRTSTSTSTSTDAHSPSVAAPSVARAAQSSTDRTILAAGDIAQCSGTGDSLTAGLIAKYPSAGVLALGDLAYPDGTATDFANCYTPTWGPFKARTRTTPGNHEYHTSGASAYYSYFGSRAGDPARGYYSFDLGAWHVVALNSNCDQIGGCGAGSAQEQWLRADLAAHRTSCALAFFHHPLFTSGEHGPTLDVKALFAALHAYRVDVVLNAHDHDYERFALQDENGAWDDYGIRQFVVGTGGGDPRGFGKPMPGSMVRGTGHGVLLMSLRSGYYAWQFLPASGTTFTDDGLARCV